jgi:hypothetical protein
MRPYPNTRGNRAQPQLGERILPSRLVQVDDRVDEELIPAQERAIQLSPRDPKSAFSTAGSGAAICCSRASTRPSFDAKKRATPLRHTQASAHSSPPPMLSKARPNAPPPSSLKPAGWSATIVIPLSPACGPSDLGGCRRSAPCSKPLISPVCARPGCRRSEHPFSGQSPWIPFTTPMDPAKIALSWARDPWRCMPQARPPRGNGPASAPFGRWGELDRRSFVH